MLLLGFITVVISVFLSMVSFTAFCREDKLR